MLELATYLKFETSSYLFRVSFQKVKTKNGLFWVNPCWNSLITPILITQYLTFNFKVGVKLNNLGQASFCQSVKLFSQRQDLEALSSSLKIGLPTLQMILEALQQNFEYDFRQRFYFVHIYCFIRGAIFWVISKNHDAAPPSFEFASN